MPVEERDALRHGPAGPVTVPAKEGLCSETPGLYPERLKLFFFFFIFLLLFICAYKAWFISPERLKL
jgi:hypothetical protein